MTVYKLPACSARVRLSSFKMKNRDFKKGVNAQDGARKREDNIVAARKNKREENLNQRRRTHTGRDALLDRHTAGYGRPVARQLAMPPAGMQERTLYDLACHRACRSASLCPAARHGHGIANHR